MANLIISIILLFILGGASLYVYKAKKSGKKCIGCPHSKECSGSCNCKK